MTLLLSLRDEAVTWCLASIGIDRHIRREIFTRAAAAFVRYFGDFIDRCLIGLYVSHPGRGVSAGGERQQRNESDTDHKTQSVTILQIVNRAGEVCSLRHRLCLCADGMNAARPDPLAIALASDHAGFEMKQSLADWLRVQGHEVIDLGPDDTASVDYPDYGYKLGRAIADGRAAFGVAVCGSGIGISIAVNRIPAARCALVSDNLSARLAREHNDANVIAFGARLIGLDTARDALSAFLSTPFAGDRHLLRVEKLGQNYLKETA